MWKEDVVRGNFSRSLISVGDVWQMLIPSKYEIGESASM